MKELITLLKTLIKKSKNVKGEIFPKETILNIEENGLEMSVITDLSKKGNREIMSFEQGSEKTSVMTPITKVEGEEIKFFPQVLKSYLEEIQKPDQ